VLRLSAGKHNEVQAAIIEQFATRFANGGVLLYIGDTADKNLFLDKDGLTKLNIPINEHSKLPDVVIYDKKRNWLFLIEAVTSHGPVSPKRIVELEKFLKNCKAGRIYVTAFPNFAEFKKHSTHIAWETEVWLTDFPDHMIHFNGDRFMGPR
jgi:type II restriction enzyme